MALIYNNSSYLCILTEKGSAAVFPCCVSELCVSKMRNSTLKSNLQVLINLKKKQKSKLNTKYYPNFTICMTNLDSILKSRDITLLTKVHLVKAVVFPIFMYGSESWTIQIAEHWRIDAFELWCWKRLSFFCNIYQFIFYIFFFFSFIFISWRLITLQYCSGFCHTLTWISHGFTCVPHPEPPSHLPPHPIPLGHPSAPAPSTCLMHPTWIGDLFHTW